MKRVIGAREPVQVPVPIDHAKADHETAMEQKFGHTVFGERIPNSITDSLTPRQRVLDSFPEDNQARFFPDELEG